MKKLFSVLVLLFSFFSLSPESSLSSSGMQIVFPRTAFVGDTLEIKYIFHSEAELFPAEAFKKSQRIELSADYDVFKEEQENFALKCIFLERLSSEYTLTLKAVSWKAGSLEIPVFDLVSLVQFSLQKDNIKSGVFLVKLKPIPVNSFVSKSGETDFRPQAAPAALPGTFIYLAFTVAFYLVLIFAFIFVILNLPATAAAIERFKVFCILRRNSRKTARKLKALLKSSGQITDDRDYAYNIQMILRAFLNTRFSNDFFSTPTNAIYSKFSDMMGGDLSDSQDNAVQCLIEIFYRTDIIRYSPNQKFLADEREALVQKALSMLLLFDTDENGETKPYDF